MNVFLRIKGKYLTNKGPQQDSFALVGIVEQGRNRVLEIISVAEQVKVNSSEASEFHFELMDREKKSRLLCGICQCVWKHEQRSGNGNMFLVLPHRLLIETELIYLYALPYFVVIVHINFTR